MGADGAWDPSQVEPGQLVLMPSMRFALLHSSQPDGKRFFIAADGSCMLCAHGEKGSTIATWCLEEQAARRAGAVPKKRSSVCDCQTACGLFAKLPKLPADAAPLPASLFDHLCATGAPAILVKGREARRLPFASGEQTTFLTSFGDLVCQHGKGRNWLLDKRRVTHSPGACACKPVAFPCRSALVGMPLGRFGGQYGKRKRQRHAPPLAHIVGALANHAADHAADHANRAEHANRANHGDRTDRTAEPSVDCSTDRSTDRSTEPGVEPSVEPNVEASVQPSVQPCAEPNVEPSADLGAEL